MKRIVLFVILSFVFSCHVFGAVVWSDEFDGPNIDKNTWTWDAGGHGFGNGQLEYNTALSQNSFIDNGDLVLKAVRENYMGNSFTSARMLTQGRFAFKYGTLEARIKLPNVANGLWPAFWLLGNNFSGIAWPDCGEVDILESGAKAGIDAGTQNELINCAIHYSIADGSYEYQASWDNASNLIPGLTDLSADYHLYKVDWTPTALTFYLDGVPFGTWDITAPHLTEYHQPQFPIINIAIGGWNYVQINDPAGITALPTAGSSAELRMDWIRLEDNAFTEITLGEDTQENGNFGILTELTPVDNALVYGDNTAAGFEFSDEAALLIWVEGAPMPPAASPATPSEGTECWSFDISAGGWYGMGVFLPNFRNMTNYSDGFLHFDIQSTLTDTMKVGIKSSRGGEFFLPIGDETAEFGFARDGAWHTISIPLNRFANIDFNTVHQMFMFAADAASASTTLSFDNIYWEPSVARPIPANGSFGVFTEDATHKDAGEFALGVDGDFFVWENTLNAAAQTPYEGAESMSFTGAGAGWFGMAFTPNVKHNLTAFSYPTSKLQFAMKTTSTTTFQVGMKSGNVDGVGQKWITFANGSDPYGFVRDGAWHVVEIPMDDMIADVDLFEVSQLFQILGFSDISNIEIDDVCFTGGGDPLTPPSGDTNIPPSVSITSPASGTFYNAGDDIVIEADATDGDGTGVVTKVEFYEGLTLLGEDLTSPYSIVFNDVAEGAYTFRAKATDPNDASRTSSSVTVYVGTPVLASISVSPAVASVQTGQLQQFNVAGSNQFGQPFPVTVDWSVDDGGVIDENGLFTPIIPGGPYTVTATESVSGIFYDTASVTVEAGGLCSGSNSSGDYTWETTGDATNPSITFIPGAPGIATTTLNFFYGRIPDGGFPGQPASPNVPVQINATAGETIYFYYTYNVPEGGERNTMNNKDSFVVGDCPMIVAGDFNGSGRTDLRDFARLAGYWLSSDCEVSNSYCGGADHDEDGNADYYDLETMMYGWLMGTPLDAIVPVVSITSPTNGTSYLPGDNVTITANASDADGSVTKVEFWAGATLLSTDTTAPYSYTWNSVPENTYILTVAAYDNEGLSTNSSGVTIYVASVTQEPAVNVTSPANGATFETGDDVTITANATDADGTITRVDFWADAVLLGTDATAPYSYTWTGVAEGTYALAAVAYDNDGFFTVSAKPTIYVQPPVVTGDLVVNEDFETGDLTGWTTNNIGAGTTLVATTESPRSGSYSAKFVTNWQSGTGVKAEIYQTVTGLSGSTSYDFELWVKGLMGAGGVAWAEIKWFNASSTQVGGTGLISLWQPISNTTYQAKGGTYTTPAGTVSAQISIRLEGGTLAAVNTMYVDDVSFSNH